MIRARKSLPWPEWPAEDRLAWDALFETGDYLIDAGAGVHWSAATRRTNRNHYGNWLGWLERTGQLDWTAAPIERASRDRVTAYARALMPDQAPATVASSLIGLKCVLRRMEPGHDWRWLKDLTNRLKVWASAQPAPSKPMAPAGQLFSVALQELHRLMSLTGNCRPDDLACRDTLIVALLIACPIRLRNLNMMQLGSHLRRVEKDWFLTFEPGETKTHQPVKLVVPHGLQDPLEHYLTEVRVRLMKDPQSIHVWLSTSGRQLACNSHYQRIRSRSADLFGVPINPHAFRTITATHLAESSASDALLARPLLGHRLATTTERHYIRASQLEASKAVSRVLEEIPRTHPKSPRSQQRSGRPNGA